MRKVVAFTIVASLAAGAAVSTARAQALGGMILAMVSGACDKLVLAGDDATGRCEGKVLNTAYPDNHSSFMFVAEKTVVSFYGYDHLAKGDKAKLDVQKITVSEGGAPTTSKPAKGTCTYTNPYAGPSVIQCSAKSEGKTYAASFTSDGKPPQVNK